MDEKKISVVSLWVGEGFQDIGLPSRYTQKLKITGDSITYKNEVTGGGFDPEDYIGRVLDSWEVKSSGQAYRDMFKAVCSDCFHLDEAQPIGRICDGSGFTIRVTYSDGTYKNYYFQMDFQWNRLDHLAYLIKKMIPNGFDYPSELDIDDFPYWNQEIVQGLIDILENHPQVERMNEPGWVEEIGQLLSPDFEYAEHIEKIRSKQIQIEHFDIGDVRAYLTYCWCSGRLYDGFMIGEIKKGTVLKVLKRLAELYAAHIEELESKMDEEGNLIR